MSIQTTSAPLILSREGRKARATQQPPPSAQRAINVQHVPPTVAARSVAKSGAVLLAELDRRITSSPKPSTRPAPTRQRKKPETADSTTTKATSNRERPTPTQPQSPEITPARHKPRTGTHTLCNQETLQKLIHKQNTLFIDNAPILDKSLRQDIVEELYKLFRRAAQAYGIRVRSVEDLCDVTTPVPSDNDHEGTPDYELPSYNPHVTQDHSSPEPSGQTREAVREAIGIAESNGPLIPPSDLFVMTQNTCAIPPSEYHSCLSGYH